MIDLTSIIMAVIGLIGAVVSAFLIPYLKNKLTSEQLSQAAFWVDIAVEAAEMIYVGSGRGAEKKEYVLKFLEDKGFTFNPGEVETLIEGMVFEVQDKLKTNKLNGGD